jgi:Flp pilus assembly protein TadD
MRSADSMLRSTCAAAVCVAMVGCASVTEPLKAMKEAVLPSSPSSSAAATPAASASAPTVTAAKPEPEAPVSPAIQRSYDDARRALRAGNTQEAERLLRAISQANPELGGPYANLGLIHRQAGKLPEAVADFEKAVAANPKQPVYLNQLGVTYRQNGQFTKARDAYERAIALDANYASAVLNLGILHDMYLADGKRALELYDRYLVLTPGGDAQVAKWIADLKNRKPPQQPQPANAAKKEKA